ncbi:reverse transcriptase domain-containing protein [Tanacetum coccineum]
MIKALRSYMGGIYQSQEFDDHLKNCGIISQIFAARKGHFLKEDLLFKEMNKAQEIAIAAVEEQSLRISHRACFKPKRYYGLMTSNNVYFIASFIPSKVSRSRMKSLPNLRIYATSDRMGDPNITIEEYIMLEEEKAQNHDKVFNWETAKYGKIRYDEDIHDLRSVETEFPAIAFNDEVSSKTLSCEPTVSSLNDEIDFRVSFDDSDDEDYMCPNVMKRNKTFYTFNDLFSFNVIYPDDLKSDEDNDDDKIDIEHSSGDLSVKPLPDVINTDDGAYAHGSNKLLETSIDTAYPGVHEVCNTSYPGDIIETEMQFMYQNPGFGVGFPTLTGKAVGSIWVFKKNINMDGNMQTYKASMDLLWFEMVLRMISEVELQALADLKSILYGLRSKRFGIEFCVEHKIYVRGVPLILASMRSMTGGRTGRGGRRTRGRIGDQGNGGIDEQGGQVGGQGNGVNDSVDGVSDFSTIIAQKLQNLLPTILAQVGNQGSNQGNGRNQNGDAVNDNIPEYDGKGGAIVYTRWIKKMESVHNMSGYGDNQKVKYTAGSYFGKALTWWNSHIHTRSQEAAVGMSWEDFKTLTREEFFPVNEMQKLETEFWNHAMVEAGHAAYTDRFYELARLVPHLVTLENKRIERYIYGLAP